MSSRAAWRLEALGFTEVHCYSAGKADWGGNGLQTEGQLASVPRIGALAHADVPTCGASDTLGLVLDQLRQGNTDVCVVINAERVVLGVVRGHALLADPNAKVEDVMDPAPATYRPNQLVHEMAHHLEQTGAKRVLVTTSEGALVGLLRREDLVDGPHLASEPTEVHTHG